MEIIFRGTNDPVLRETVLKLSANTIRRLEVTALAVLTNCLNGDNSPVVPSEFDSDKRLCETFEVIAECVTQLTEITIYGPDFQTAPWDCLKTLINANLSLHTLIFDSVKAISQEVVDAICAAPDLTTVELTSVTFAQPPRNAPIAPICSVNLNVKTLTYYAHINITPLPEIFCRLPNITSLNGLVDAGVLEELSSLVPLVSEANLTFSARIEDSMALSIAKNWPYLTRLTLQSRGELSEDAGEVCSEKTMLLFLKHCPLLQYLNLCEYENDQIVGFEDAEEDEDESEERDPSLDSLRDDLTGPGSHLQVLRVECLSAAGLQAVVTQCKHLHTLGIYHIEPPPLSSMHYAERALHLLAKSSVKTLHLKNFYWLSNADLEALCGLEELRIQHDGASTTYAGLVGVAARCPALHTLCISAESGVTRDCVLWILQNCPLLRSLELCCDDCEDGTADLSDPEQWEIFKQEIQMRYPLLRTFENIL